MKLTPFTSPHRSGLFITGICMLGITLTGFNRIQTRVYICKGPQSTKYHYRQNCRGLSSCSTDIYKVTLSEAKQLGRGLCGWED